MRPEPEHQISAVLILRPHNELRHEALLAEQFLHRFFSYFQSISRIHVSGEINSQQKSDDEGMFVLQISDETDSRTAQLSAAGTTLQHLYRQLASLFLCLRAVN